MGEPRHRLREFIHERSTILRRNQASQRQIPDKKSSIAVLSPRPFFRNEPFGENVEEISHGGDWSCVFEPALQKHDFENSALRRVIGRIDPRHRRPTPNCPHQMATKMMEGAALSGYDGSLRSFSHNFWNRDREEKP
jgi:hypothetical protein